ncbi:hypothetical protein M9H77_10648 [Catharanthus roseus]|uniref:Uncharacterized protein n=1 Tax=Catharanthus roseus TaxID=4058 RepID=A0ACC0BCD4_CATRO|nr:hypothetical protein M9H77_10648 [Catharanthus roseus]
MRRRDHSPQTPISVYLFWCPSPSLRPDAKQILSKLEELGNFAISQSKRVSKRVSFRKQEWLGGASSCHKEAISKNLTHRQFPRITSQELFISQDAALIIIKQNKKKKNAATTMILACISYGQQMHEASEAEVYKAPEGAAILDDQLYHPHTILSQSKDKETVIEEDQTFS